MILKLRETVLKKVQNVYLRKREALFENEPDIR